MKAAIYLRVSTASQAGADHVSLSVQENICRDFVDKRGGDVVEVLRDEGRSGLDIDRPAYQQLFELARAKVIDAVVVFRLDRLGRDAAEFLLASKRLRLAGCAVHSATEPTENNLVAGIIALLAEDESSRIRARTLPAMVARMKSGRWVGRAPKGYDIVPHPEGGATLKPNDDAWKIRRLFELYATGKYSLAKMQRETTILGLSDRENGMTRSHILEVLTSPAYTGRVVWGRTVKERTETGKHVHRRKPGTWYEFDGYHEAIVERELFDQVQARLALNRQTQGPPTPNRQLLIGRIYCSCGSRMAAKVSQKGKHGQVYYCYFCIRRAENRDARVCTQSQISVRKIDALVQEAVTRTFGDVAEVHELATKIIDSDRDDHLGVLAQRKRQLEQAARRLANERQNLARHFARRLVKADVYQETDAGYASQLTSINVELADLGDVEVPDVRSTLDLVCRIKWADLDREEWREALHELIESVSVMDREVEVLWRDGAEALCHILQGVR